jgi:16S rRNA (adenine1518-N6/adenine1519-N6)-dimethyltransferase
LEIGPGDGRLTKLLANKAAHITAVEKDERMLEHLLPLLEEYNNIEIIHADFLDLDFEGKKFDAVVSNVPYVISSPLLFKLATMSFARAVLCFQKEFAERMLTEPGDKKRSRLSVMAQLHFDVKKLESVPRTAFRPKPKVDSMIVELKRKSFTASEFQSDFINKLFQHKARTVKKALHDAYRLSASTKYDERRVFSLTNQEILQLAGSVEKHLHLRANVR